MTATIWDGLWPGQHPAPALGAGAVAASQEVRRQVLWEHCRNSLGIARLLVREGRSSGLIYTACHVAVEMACRAALSVSGEPAVVAEVQAVLPADLRPPEGDFAASERLAAAERAVGWVADYLRSAIPGPSWGF
ncbi:MAG TPA: hypothetical protein VFO85_09030 [Vicinamibacteria bacterium]|nr:hypothetical protein [Vicinamibacteria bacterium]